MAKVDLRVALISLIATITTACSGSVNGPSAMPINPMAASGGFAPSAASTGFPKEQRRRTRIALDKVGKALKLPPTAAMSERITLPPNDAPPGASLEVTVSNALPRTVPQLPARKGEAFMSFTLEASADVTLRGIPNFSVRLPSEPANHGAFYAWAFSPQNGWRDVGPMTVSGNVLTFGGGRKNVKLQRGIAYAIIPFTGMAFEGAPGTVLFVANFGSNKVTEYAPPYTGAPIATISNRVSGPAGLAFDARGRLFVANNSCGANNVTEYASPYTGAPIATIRNTVSGPFGLTFDASGNLFVTNAFNAITEYAPPYTGAPTTLIAPNGLDGPIGMAFDASSNLFVANFASNTITEYAPPYTGNPFSTISNSVKSPFGLTFDASGNLFVANYLNNTVTEYSPPYTGAPIATISNSVSGPVGLAFDASGNLFVANSSNNTVTEYAPPYDGMPTAKISNSVSGPQGLAFGPGN